MDIEINKVAQLLNDSKFYSSQPVLSDTSEEFNHITAVYVINGRDDYHTDEIRVIKDSAFHFFRKKILTKPRLKGLGEISGVIIEFKDEFDHDPWYMVLAQHKGMTYTYNTRLEQKD